MNEATYRRLTKAMRAMFKHPHIQAYLPYDPNDPIFREAIAALKEAEADQANQAA